MQQARLGSLPLEICHMILEDLDIDSIKCLRLTSKSICSLCNGPYWFRYFETWQTDFSESNLLILRDLSKHALLSKMVRYLRIAVVPFHTAKIKNREDEKVLELGPQIRKGLSSEATLDILCNALRSFSCLRTVELANCCDRLWYYTWCLALTVFKISISAIVKSNVQLQSLLCFKGSSASLCGIQSSDITRILSDLGGNSFFDVVSNVQEFAISWSQQEEMNIRSYADEYAGVSVLPYFGPDQNPTSIISLLSKMPNITSLTLCMYGFFGHNTDPPLTGVFEYLAKDCQLINLQHVSLTGISTTQKSLTEFLTKHPFLVDARIMDTHIRGDESWNPILAMFNKIQMPNIKQIYLSNLYKGTWVANLVTHDETVVLTNSGACTIGIEEYEHLALNFSDCYYYANRNNYIYIHSRIYLQPQIYRGVTVRENERVCMIDSSQNASWSQGRRARLLTEHSFNGEFRLHYYKQQEENLRQMDAGLKKLGLMRH